MTRPRSVAGLTALSVLAGCGTMAPFHPTTPNEAAATGSPLGPSYILVPLPNDDDSLLGRVLLDVPDKGRALDEVSRPNECADKLTPKKEGPIASTFEDGQELAAGGKARPAESETTRTAAKGTPNSWATRAATCDSMSAAAALVSR